MDSRSPGYLPTSCAMRVRPDPVRPQCHRYRQWHGRADGGYVARSALRDAVSHLDIANGAGTAHREIEGATEIVTFPLPAVLSIDEGLGTSAQSIDEGHHVGQEEADGRAARQIWPGQSDARINGPATATSARTDRRRRGGGSSRIGAAASRGNKGDLMADVFVFAESRGGALRQVAFEAVSAARAVADAAGGGDVHAMVVGAPGIAPTAEALGQFGADGVFAVEHPGLGSVQPGSRGRDHRGTIKDRGYRLALFAASS